MIQLLCRVGLASFSYYAEFVSSHSAIYAEFVSRVSAVIPRLSRVIQLSYRVRLA